MLLSLGFRKILRDTFLGNVYETSICMYITYIYININILIYIYIYVIYIYIHLYIHTSLRTCVCLCVFVSFVCVHIDRCRTFPAKFPSSNSRSFRGAQ